MIVINARFLTQQITGVQRYAIEICEHLPKYIKEQEVILVAPKGDLLNEKKINNHRIVKVGKLKGQLWEQIDLLHFLKNNNNSSRDKFTRSLIFLCLFQQKIHLKLLL